ncbi:MAG TPA: ferritin-like domain-containing protein [Acidimicrobiales bacterium]|nr:ferritin-like domain-containing protein [Acidimicrobiales bacterium]
MTTHDHPITDRRRFLAMGGVAGAALLAACGTKNDSGATKSTTTSTVAPSASDIAFLQLASSLEAFEVAVYQRAIDGGLIQTPGLLATVKQLQKQHAAHATLLEGHTTRLGGQGVDKPNASLMGQLKPMTDEASFLRIAVDIAQMAAATYQVRVGNVKDSQLNVILASIGGIEARHAALFGGIVGVQLPAASFNDPNGKAVSPSTGA